MPHRLDLPAGIPPRPKRRFGLLTKTVLLLFLACVFMLLVTAVFAPWGFYLGGHFHPIPYWQGWGRVHVAGAGGDYILFVRLEPSSRGSKMYLSTNLKGIAYLCTPNGERYRLSLGGSMARHLPVDTTGQSIYLYMSKAPSWIGTDRRPSLNFYGNWGDRELVLDDHGAISAVFLPDGTLKKEEHDRNHPMGKEIAHLTLKEGSNAEFEAACRSQMR